MSETTEHTSSQCDSLLDYAYGELSGDALEQFKLHLLTCEKCKRELAGLERVRSAVKRAMPMVEPAPDKMSAMHAQLMHAAAQQKPKRGKVLTFARRMVSHPAYAAAAAFVIVGGAVAYNFSMGRTAMPVAEKALHEPLAPIVAAPPPATPATPTTPTTDDTTTLKGAPAGGVAPADVPVTAHAAAADKPLEKFANRPEPKIVLKTESPSAEYAVKRAPERKEADNLDDINSFGGGGGYKAGKDQSLGKKGLLEDRSPRDEEQSKNEGGVSTRRHASSAGELARGDFQGNAVSGAGVATKAPVATTAAPQEAAPPPPPRYYAEPAKKAKQDSYRSVDGRMTQQAPMAQAPTNSRTQIAQNQAGPAAEPAAPAPAKPAPVLAPPPAQSASAEREAQPAGESPALAADGKTRAKEASPDLAQLKREAQALADAGNCDEAIKRMQLIDKLNPKYLTQKERSAYLHCTSTNRAVQAETEQQADQENKANASRSSKKASKAKPSAPASSKPAY